jgi:2-polyprenyl-6-methoxyphenol hydroxylase-like FAD-dependent oxidoreductase
MSKSNFRVIVIGGGPVGLATGHALAAAGIDYVILERQSAIISPSGASVMLWSHCVRLLDQLGLLEAAEEVHMPVHKKTNTLLDGTLWETCDIFDKLEER